MTADSRSRPIARVAPLLLGLALLSGCDGPPPAIVERAALIGHTREISSVAFTPDGKTLASRGADAVKLWSLAGGKELASFEGDGSEMGTVTFSPDGSTVATTLSGKGAIARDVASKRVHQTYLHPTRSESASGGPAGHAWGLAYSPDGKTLAGGGTTGGVTGFVTLWDTAIGTGAVLDQPGGPVTSVAIASDGKTLAAKGLGESIVLWDLARRAERRTILVGRSFGAPVAFSPDGKTLASAGEDRRVKLWDAATGGEVAALKWHLKAVLSAAFHPGGKLLASGDAGGKILLWDLRLRNPIARFDGHQGKVWSLAFSPDGRMLASAGEDCIVRLWDVGEPIAP